jgi:hypothetical protein
MADCVTHYDRIDFESPLCHGTGAAARNVVFLAGPGEGTWDAGDVRTWAGALAPQHGSLLTLGDGVRDVSLDAISATFDQAAALPGATTVCVVAHGVDYDDQHVCLVGEEDALRSAELFCDLRRAFGRRAVDVALFSCCSGMALADLDELPRGSRLGVFTWPWEGLAYHRAAATFQNLHEAPPKTMDAEAIYEAFLASSDGLSSMPALGVAGKGIELPAQAVDVLDGCALTEGERKKIRRKLEPHFSKAAVETTMGRLWRTPEEGIKGPVLAGDLPLSTYLAARAVLRPLAPYQTYQYYATKAAPRTA